MRAHLLAQPRHYRQVPYTQPCLRHSWEANCSYFWYYHSLARAFRIGRGDYRLPTWAVAAPCFRKIAFTGAVGDLIRIDGDYGLSWASKICCYFCFCSYSTLLPYPPPSTSNCYYSFLFHVLQVEYLEFQVHLALSLFIVHHSKLHRHVWPDCHYQQQQPL